MCGKRLIFLYTSPSEHVQYAFEVPRLSTFVFKKCSEKYTFTIKYSDFNLKGFD